MITLFRKHGKARDAWIMGNRYECHGHESPRQFRDAVSTAVWLRSFEPDDLRRVADRYSDGTPLSCFTDHAIIERMAGLIVAGSLRVCRAGTKHERDANKSGSSRDVNVESGIIFRLRVTAREFTFEGDQYRVISADQWSSLRGDDGERYQVVPSDAAQTLLKKIAEWPAIESEEKRAIEEAISLVPDTRLLKIPSGILLVRIIARPSAFWGKGSSEPAITPSQLVRRETKDKVHWVEVVLVDDADQPVANEPYKLELPDGEIRKGRLDSSGRVYIGDIKDAGQCKVCFPEIDAKEWRAA